MPKFRKIPVEIEAIQFTRKNHDEVVRMFPGITIFTERCPNGKMHGEVKTLEGTMRVTEGDYIVRGVEGELYPCKPSIFEKTYEQVKDGD